MKRIFAVLAILSLVFLAGPAMADSADSYAGAAGVAGSTYDANGYLFSGGEANANVARPVKVNFDTRNVAGAFSSQSVDSDATAYGLSFRPQSVTAYGEAQQWTGASVNPAYGTWAVGSQSSGAKYNAKDSGLFCAYVEGDATTTGGTLVGAARFDTSRSSTAVAGAVTGSSGNAYAGCDSYDTDVWGSGSVEHSTYANKGAGEAWTGGSASYSYYDDGRHFASGSGMAGTFGMSNVTRGCNGVTATAVSTSFSTNGPTNANGGTHIDTF